MNLYKYSFAKGKNLTSSNDLTRFEIKKIGKIKHNGRRGSYITTYSDYRNYVAQYKLSITSTPNFRYRLRPNDISALESSGDLRFLDNAQKQLPKSSSLVESDLPRTWPSFGYFGGARECFAEFNQSKNIALINEHPFPIPGRRDFYHFDDDERLNPSLISSIIKGIQDIFDGFDLQIREEYAQLKVIGNGVSVNINHIFECDNNVTASIAFHETPLDTFIKCWVNIWRDDENSKKRLFFLTQTAEYFFRSMNLNFISQVPSISQAVFQPLYTPLLQSIASCGCFDNTEFYVKLTN